MRRILDILFSGCLPLLGLPILILALFFLIASFVFWANHLETAFWDKVI
jgi:hypothetical protein